MLERTLAIIKPDAVAAGHIGDIISLIELAGLKIFRMRYGRFSRGVCNEFCEEHIGKPFYDELVDFMSSGNCIAMVLEGENAIKQYRDLMCSTNQANAACASMRRRFGGCAPNSAVHGSDFLDSARYEIDCFII
jgi:nucleoside-diphosphate kinase